MSRVIIKVGASTKVRLVGKKPNKRYHLEGLVAWWHEWVGAYAGRTTNVCVEKLMDFDTRVLFWIVKRRWVEYQKYDFYNYSITLP